MLGLFCVKQNSKKLPLVCFHVNRQELDVNVWVGGVKVLLFCRTTLLITTAPDLVWIWPHTSKRTAVMWWFYTAILRSTCLVQFCVGATTATCSYSKFGGASARNIWVWTKVEDHWTDRQIDQQWHPWCMAHSSSVGHQVKRLRHRSQDSSNSKEMAGNETYEWMRLMQQKSSAGFKSGRLGFVGFNQSHSRTSLTFSLQETPCGCVKDECCLSRAKARSVWCAWRNLKPLEGDAGWFNVHLFFPPMLMFLLSFTMIFL